MATTASASASAAVLELALMSLVLPVPFLSRLPLVQLELTMAVVDAEVV